MSTALLRARRLDVNCFVLRRYTEQQQTFDVDSTKTVIGKIRNNWSLYFPMTTFPSVHSRVRLYLGGSNAVRATEFCRSKMWNLNSTKTSIFCAKNKVATNPPALGNIQDISPRTNFIVTMWRYLDRNDRSMKIHQLLIRRLIDHLFCSV